MPVCSLVAILVFTVYGAIEGLVLSALPSVCIGTDIENALVRTLNFSPPERQVASALYSHY